MLKLVLTLTSLLICTCESGFGQTPAELITLLKDGHAKLALSEASHSQYRWTLKARSPAESKITKQDTSISSSYGICYQVGEQRLLESGILENVGGVMKADAKRGRICKSNKYTFAVQNNDGNSGWALKFFDHKNPKEAFAEIVGGTLPALFPLRTLADQWKIEDILANETCKISSVRSNSNGLIVADFFAKVGPDKSMIFKGTFTTSKDNDYVIIECQFTLTDSANTNSHYVTTITREVEKVGDQIRCRSYTSKGKNTNTGKIDFEEQYEFSDYSSDPVDSSQFELEYYGITSPVDGIAPTRKRTTWPIWIAITAISFTLAMIFRWLSRRRK